MTPLMRQYWDIKAAHEDKILLFRMGDFYEMFFDDAKTAAPILGIALTQRNKKSEDETPMCGVPHHSIAGPINKLLKAGRRVAICDQLEDPSQAKGIVKRGVTRVLTPGMVYDPETLDSSISNYLACYEEEILALAETSTGEAFYFENCDLKELQRLLDVLPIAELLVSDSLQANIEKGLVKYTGLCTQFSQSTLGEDDKSELSAIVILKKYILKMAGENNERPLKAFEKRSLQQRMDLSSTVIRHLEIFATYKGEGAGSLFQAMDRTKTSGGARMLRQWMLFPLVESDAIVNRWNRLEGWTQRPSVLKLLREGLGGVGDLERRFAKLTQPQVNGRDLLSLAASLGESLKVIKIAEGQTQSLSEDMNKRLQICVEEIEKTLVSEPPLTIKQGHIIQKGVSQRLDELIELSTNSQKLLAEMEAREKEATGISSLKIRYNNVFGYYIEVTNTHSEKVPSHYQRKQTLTNAERFCTPELIELERKVLSAQSQRGDLEYEIFETLRKKVLGLTSEIFTLAQIVSELDVVTSLAWLAIERKFCRPQFSQDRQLKIQGSRHPVVEIMVKTPFISNDIEMSPQGCLLLTGPNMAGKSTLMRQVALTVIMAQMGSFVPAQSAILPLMDHIFTRIGASDQLSEGLSTFMVEMTETAEMLRKSSAKSLLVLDEIGRGTSTFDGMSLAQSILEFILSETRALCLFATHYHELTKLEIIYPQLKNAHMSVSDRGGEIRFLHTLKNGPAQKSYGIQVAKLAGLPAKVTERATHLLREIEGRGENTERQLSFLEMSTEQMGINRGPFEGFDNRDPKQNEFQNQYDSTNEPMIPEGLQKLIEELTQVDLLRMTPISALAKLESLQNQAKNCV